MANTNTKNIYQKIQSVRVDLAKKNLKKTGNNTYSKFKYYELADFLPTLNGMMKANGLMTVFTMEKEKAVLKIFNSDKPEEFVTFYTPTAEVEIGKSKTGGGAQPIQNLGGKITYLRRYLLMVAFEIVEADVVDDKKQDYKYQLDMKEIGKIEKVETLEELKDVCKGIKEKKGVKYQPSLLKCYTEKKEEIEKETK